MGASSAAIQTAESHIQTYTDRHQNQRAAHVVGRAAWLLPIARSWAGTFECGRKRLPFLKGHARRFVPQLPPLVTEIEHRDYDDGAKGEDGDRYPKCGMEHGGEEVGEVH